MALHPDLVDEANEDLKRRGVNGQYTKEGKVGADGKFYPAGTFEAFSRKARHDECKDRNYPDRDGGYSDYCGE